MEVTFSYTGQLANLSGISEESVSLDSGSTLGAVVQNIADRHGRSFSDLILDEAGNFRRALLVIADGEQLDGERERFCLEGVNNIVLMTPIAGG